MSLRAKFAMLLGFAGSILLLALIVSVWSAFQLTQQIGGPFLGLTSSMIERQEIEKNLGLIESAIARNDFSAAAQAATDAAQRADNLAEKGWFDTGIGSRTAAVLRDGLKDLNTTINAIHDQPQQLHDTHKQNITDLLHMLQSLLRRIESRLLEDATLALSHADNLPRELLLVVLAAALLGTLILALGIALIQRWVLAPVSRLRDATEHIGDGDFKYRIPVQGNDELATLSAEVNHMAETIEQLLDERLDKERLAAIGGMVRRLAHNLRNPLAGIRGLAELTRSEIPEHHEAREHQQRIIEAVDRFERWLSDLLNVSTPTAIHQSPQNPVEWLQQVVRLCEPAAKSKNIRIDFDSANCPQTADFDAPQLEQAVIAVIANAIEASPSAGVVKILANGPEQADPKPQHIPTWSIKIQDQGQGVPEPLRDKVFGAYFTTKPDGKGIGLAVAQQIVQAHKGRIELQTANPTNPNAPGAQFTLTIPVRKQGSLAPKQYINNTNGRHIEQYRQINVRKS